MKLITAVIFVIFGLSLAVPAYSQAVPRCVFDNFDASTGVRIEVAPTPNPDKKRGRKVVPTIMPITSSAPYVAKTDMQPYVNQPISGQIIGTKLAGFTTGDIRIDGFMVAAAERNSVDPMLLYSIMHQESTFKRNAISPKGARGLMQLMPGTAARFGVRNIFDPEQNIEGGARYVKFLLDMFDGDVSLALAGYNAGEGAVLRYGRQVPPYRETQEYVRRISNRYAVMRDPSVLQHAPRVSSSQLSSAEKTIPLAVYERTVSAVRLPDGRLVLASQ